MSSSIKTRECELLIPSRKVSSSIASSPGAHAGICDTFLLAAASLCRVRRAFRHSIVSVSTAMSDRPDVPNERAPAPFFTVVVQNSSGIIASN